MGHTGLTHGVGTAFPSQRQQIDCEEAFFTGQYRRLDCPIRKGRISSVQWHTSSNPSSL